MLFLLTSFVLFPFRLTFSLLYSTFPFFLFYFMPFIYLSDALSLPFDIFRYSTLLFAFCLLLSILTLPFAPFRIIEHHSFTCCQVAFLAFLFLLTFLQCLYSHLVYCHFVLSIWTFAIEKKKLSFPDCYFLITSQRLLLVASVI